MSNCPYCQTEYLGYSIVGVVPANERLTGWLDPVPVAQLFCEDCGRYTFMHPDHPDVQRMRKGKPFEELASNTRTLNVQAAEVGDDGLRGQFEKGRDE
ncbi:MAG: hypothetical protein ACRDFS_00505 [Chloroflexota bacterium]